MIDFSNIKTILQIAGISHLELTFDGELQIVNAEYVFKGNPGHKQITWEEIITSLAIRPSMPPVSEKSGLAAHMVPPIPPVSTTVDNKP